MKSKSNWVKRHPALFYTLFLLAVAVIVIAVLLIQAPPQGVPYHPENVENAPTPIENRTLVWSGVHIDRNLGGFFKERRLNVQATVRYAIKWKGGEVYPVNLENGTDNIRFLIYSDKLTDGFIYKFVGSIYSVHSEENELYEFILLPNEISYVNNFTDYYIFEGTVEPITVRGEIRTRDTPLWSGSHYDRVISMTDNFALLEHGIEDESGTLYRRFKVAFPVEVGKEYVLNGSLMRVYAFDVEIDNWFWERRNLDLPQITKYSYYEFYPDSVVEVGR